MPVPRGGLDPSPESLRTLALRYRNEAAALSRKLAYLEEQNAGLRAALEELRDLGTVQGYARRVVRRALGGSDA